MTDRNWKKNTGEMPVDGDQMVAVRFRNDDPNDTVPRLGLAVVWSWGIYNNSCDITHWNYEPPKENHND